MLGNHHTTIRFILAFNQSLYNKGDLSEFSLNQVIPSTNYFTRLSVEKFPSLSDKFLKRTKYLSVMEWAALHSKTVRNLKGLSLQFIAQGPDDVLMSGFAGGGKMTCIQQHFQGNISSYIYKANLARETQSLHSKAQRGDKIIWDDALMIAHLPEQVTFSEVLSVDAATNNLKAALIAIEEYALGEECKKSWAKQFRNALSLLEGDGETADYTDISDVTTHLSLDAIRLLNASSNSWVFGGMGSWNDGVGEGNYQEVTDSLFKSIHESYVSVCAESLNKSSNR